MKIGLVLSAPPSYSETFFNSKIKGLQEDGYNVVLYTQSKESDFSLCLVKTAPPIFKRNLIKQLSWFVLIYFKLLLHLKPVLKFIKLEKQQKSSLIQIFKKTYVNAHILTEKLDWLHFGFATMALGKENVAQSIGAQLAVSLRGFDMTVYPIKYSNCYEILWQRVNKIHTISDYLLKLAIENGLPIHVEVQKITPAIDIVSFCNDNYKKSTKLSLITIARLHWVKGLGDTLKALAILKREKIEFSYTIVGDGKLFEALTFMIHTLDLNSEVKLVGEKSLHEVKELLSKHEVYIQYSHSEGFCNAALEAQAMGLLCIVSDAGGLPENVLDTQSGWVAPKRNPQKLAETIITVSKMLEKEKNIIREFAISRVQKEFNLAKQQQEFLKFYMFDEKVN